MGIRKFVERFREKPETAIPTPQYLTTLPAPTDGDFPLRTKQEERLYQALCQRGRHILLYGPGGTGKTHMARKLFYRLSQEYPRLAWVEYGTGIRHSMTRSQEKSEGNPEQWFDLFIQKLEESERDTILFIDDAKEDAMDDAALSQITGMGITILMTSRCSEISPYETWKLEPVSTGECADLFYANYHQDSRQRYRKTVLRLAEQLDCNVFAMLLLANVAGAPNNLPQLEKRLRKGKLMDHVGQLMAASRLTRKQRQILRCLSLTASGELLEDLVHWLEFPDSDVEALIQGGWLVRNRDKDCLVLHDLVREYCNREPPDRQTVERFVKGALGEQFHSRAQDYAPAAFKGKALDFQIRAVEIMEQYWDSKEDLAHAYSNVGIMLAKFGDYRRALEYCCKALSIRERILSPDHTDLAVSYGNVGSCYDELGDYVKALEYRKKTLSILEKVLPPDHPDLAISYGNMGSSYDAVGDHAKALKYKEKALSIHENVLAPNYSDLAVSYNNMGYTCSKLGNQDKALEYYHKALAIRENVLSQNHPDIASSCNNIAVTYAAQGQYAQALEWMRRALEIAEYSLPENHPDRSAYQKGVEYLEQRLNGMH